MTGLTVDNFFQFWTGIYGDFDGAYGCQCEDLVNYYSRWIGGKQFTGDTADQIYGQDQGGFYQVIPNEPENFPQKGDIIVWNWPHCGVATGSNTDVWTFEVLEQNDPVKSPSHMKTYQNYDGVLGWLRPVHLPQ